MNLLWLVVPVALTIGGIGLVLGIRVLDDARRGMQQQVIDLADARGALQSVQRRIDATRATAVERTRR